MDKLPGREEFAAQVNTTFKAANAENEFEITLVEVKSVISNNFQECFALLFKAPADVPPVQQLFSLTHEVFGELEIFLVPVKKNESGLFFEAVFNSLLA